MQLQGKSCCTREAVVHQELVQDLGMLKVLKGHFQRQRTAADRHIAA